MILKLLIKWILLLLYDDEIDQIWLVGDGLSKEEQLKARKGTIFIPFSLFPPKKIRDNCFYHYTPAMVIPKDLENIDSCEVSNVVDF